MKHHSGAFSPLTGVYDEKDRVDLRVVRDDDGVGGVGSHCADV